MAKLNYSNISILYNPVSTGDAVSMAKELYKQLLDADTGVSINFIETRYAGHDEKLAYKLASNSKRPLIISVSGDGGYNNVINGAVRAADQFNTAPICAVHGAGNANDHRRTMAEMPLFEAIMAQNERQIDLLQIAVTLATGKKIVRYAHSYAGLGLTPEVAVELNKHSLTRWKEMILTIQTFAAHEAFRLELPNGDQLEYDSLLFGNINQMAKVLTLSKNSAPDDGAFELISTPHVGKVRLAGEAAKAAIVGFNEPTTIKKFDFTVVKAMPMQLDGEVFKLHRGNKVHVSIAPYKLSVIV